MGGLNPWVRGVGALCLVGLIVGCGGRKRRTNDEELPERSGQAVPRVALKYIDRAPTVSSNGQKIVFISGRTDTLKAYKYELGGTAGRVTDETQNLGDEFEATVSPNGGTVAILSSLNGVTDLYLRDYAAALTAEKVAETATSTESEPAFSPDSVLIAFTRRDSGSSNSHVYVAKITSGVTAGTPVQLTGSSSNESSPTWVSTGVADSYQLVAKRKNTSSFTGQLVSYTFTVAGDVIGSATSTDIASSIEFSRSVPLAGASTGVFYVAPNESLTSQRGAQTPEGTVTSSKTVAVKSRARLLSTTGTSTTDFEPSGSDITGVSSSTDGTTGIWSIREAYSCEADKLVYGTTMFLFQSSGSAFNRLIPVVGDNDALSLSDGVCTENTDRNIVSAKISGSATASAYTVAYSTWKTGDLEVKAMALSGGVTTFYNVSNNKQP